MAALTIARMIEDFVISPGTATTFAPRSSNSHASALVFSLLNELMTTLDPSFASVNAISLPIPLPHAEMSDTLPSNFMG